MALRYSTLTQFWPTYGYGRVTGNESSTGYACMITSRAWGRFIVITQTSGNNNRPGGGVNEEQLTYIPTYFEAPHQYFLLLLLLIIIIVVIYVEIFIITSYK